MAKQDEKEERKPAYEKPLFEKTEGMTFTAEIWNNLAGGQFGCMQCSACHGCA
jgi:hypothetical protein